MRQYRDANLELAYRLDPSDKALAAARARARSAPQAARGALAEDLVVLRARR